MNELGKEEKIENLNKNDGINNKNDIKSIENDFIKGTPQNGGNWLGERGNSKWNMDDEIVPKKENPDNLNWKEIKEKYQFETIEFKDGKPDFTCVSKGCVEIENFSGSRDINFRKADIEYSKENKMTPRAVSDFRKSEGYTWHERSDCKTMDLVPSTVHNNIPHYGGIYEFNKKYN